MPGTDVWSSIVPATAWRAEPSWQRAVLPAPGCSLGPHLCPLCPPRAGGHCFYRIEEYWTFELCYQKQLRQYHKEGDSVQVSRRPPGCGQASRCARARRQAEGHWGGEQPARQGNEHVVASSGSAAGGTRHVQTPHRLRYALSLQAEYVLGKWSGGEEAQQEADKVEVGRTMRVYCLG